ncbi:MAG: MotB family protein [Hyphomicrobiales bacterium]|nr:MotB family protein [Hyphomicrobiales bacterium]
MSAHPEIVIIKRRGALEDSHHGGAWKIAFADFMTAMMAFFLVLWIISATDKNTKTLIARYFNPVKVEEPAKAQKGIHGAPEQDTDAPGTESGAPNAEKPRSDQGQTARGSVRESSASPLAESQEKHLAKPEPKAPPDPAKPNPSMSEDELFSDPRASLDKIAGVPPPGPRLDPTATLKGYGEVGPSADDALRDPFRPLGSDRTLDVVSPNPGAPPEANDVRDESKPPAEAHRPSAAVASPLGPAEKEANPPSRAAFEQTKTETPQASEAKVTVVEKARADAAAALLADVKKRLGEESQSLPGPELDVQATDEGILISLTDRQNYSMFAIGSAEPQPRVVRMMDAIAMSLETMPGVIVVRGHTDAHPYRSKTYDNWRLSSARAQMAYYMLNRGGVAEKRFERIEGFADHRLKDPAHPFAADNRRIEILLREETQ